MILAIKGTAAEARRACCARGVHEITTVGEEQGVAWVSVPDHVKPEAIAWFCEPPFEPPHPAGTLLFYTEPQP